MDPIGKGFFAQLIWNKAPAPPSHMDHGFLPRRRKESALLVQMCGAWRLKNCGFNFLMNNHDLANAFGSTDWEALEEANRLILTEADLHFGEQRYRWSAIGLPLGAGEELLVRNKCGAPMGDPYVVHSFPRAFATPTRQWQMQAKNYNELHNAMLVKDPVTGLLVDLSLSKYADDLVKLLPVPAGSPVEKLAALSAASNESLDFNLKGAGFEQNIKKQKAIVFVQGPGSVKAKHSLRAGNVSLVGQPVDFARSLGGLIGPSGAFAHELGARIKAVKAAYSRLGAFWVQENVPWRWRRSVFLGTVVNTALAGIEAFLPSKAQYDKLSMLVAQLGRRSMLGKACWQGSAHKHCMTWQEVLTYWQIAPMHTEAKIRRLRWYQVMVEHPKDFVQVFAAIFGQMRAEVGPTSLVGGYLSKDANPWAKRFLVDILSMGDGMESAENLVEALEKCPLRLFSRSELGEEFCSLDVGELRNRCFRASVPPPGFRPVVGDVGEAAVQCDGAYICGVEECGAVFRDRQGVLDHIMSAHGWRCLANLLTHSNACVICSETFSSQYAAARHLARAIDKGKCPPRVQTSLLPLALPADLQCRLCEFEGTDLQDLGDHCRLHLPWVVLLPRPRRHRQHGGGTNLDEKRRVPRQKGSKPKGTGAGKSFARRHCRGIASRQSGAQRERRQGHLNQARGGAGEAGNAEQQGPGRSDRRDLPHLPPQEQRQHRGDSPAAGGVRLQRGGESAQGEEGQECGWRRTSRARLFGPSFSSCYERPGTGYGNRSGGGDTGGICIASAFGSGSSGHGSLLGGEPRGAEGRDRHEVDALLESDCEVQIPGGHGGYGEGPEGAEVAHRQQEGLDQDSVLLPEPRPGGPLPGHHEALWIREEDRPGAEVGTGEGCAEAAGHDPQVDSAWSAEQPPAACSVLAADAGCSSQEQLGKSARLQSENCDWARLPGLDCSQATFRSETPDEATIGTEPRASPSQDAPTPEAVEFYEQQLVGSSNPVQVGEMTPGSGPIDFVEVEKELEGFSLESFLSADISASASSVVSERFLGEGPEVVSSSDMQNRDLRRIECKVSQALPAPAVEARRKELRSTSVRFRQVAMSRLSREIEGSSSSIPVGSQFAEIVGSRGGEDVGVRGCGVGGLLVHRSDLRSDQEPVPKGKGKEKGKRGAGQ